MTTSQPRQPKGQPVGGQFSVKQQTSDEVGALADRKETARGKIQDHHGPLLETVNGDSFYTGPLTQAKRVAREEYGDELGESQVGSRYRVNSDHEWGAGTSQEEAWRFFLGAMFGPDDSEYDEPYLRELLVSAEQASD